MNNQFEKNKRAKMSNKDNNSFITFITFTCDRCQLNKNYLRLVVDKKEKGYLCDFCIKNKTY